LYMKKSRFVKKVFFSNFEKKVILNLVAILHS
jgi:hypothetical protein